MVKQLLPADRRYKGVSDIAAVDDPAQLRLSLSYNARATVIRHTHGPDVIAAAMDVEAKLVAAKAGLTGVIRRSATDPTLLYRNARPLPAPLQQVFDAREAMLRGILAEKQGVPEDSFAVEGTLLTRLAMSEFHRDPEAAIYIETVMGPGTRLATGLGETFGLLAPLSHVRMEAGEGVLFNLDGQARHASPRSNSTTPRLGIAMFLTYNG